MEDIICTLLILGRDHHTADLTFQRVCIQPRIVAYISCYIAAFCKDFYFELFCNLFRTIKGKRRRQCNVCVLIRTGYFAILGNYIRLTGIPVYLCVSRGSRQCDILRYISGVQGKLLCKKLQIFFRICFWNSYSKCLCIAFGSRRDRSRQLNICIFFRAGYFSVIRNHTRAIRRPGNGCKSAFARIRKFEIQHSGFRNRKGFLICRNHFLCRNTV